jgi:hypothetical protein
VGTSIFGATVLAGTTFTAIGFGADKSGLKTAGLITLPLGAIGLFASIYAIVKSGSRVEVTDWNGQSDQPASGAAAPPPY